MNHCLYYFLFELFLFHLFDMIDQLTFVLTLIVLMIHINFENEIIV